MSRRVSLGLVGAFVAPAVLVAFVIGLILAGVLNFGPRAAEAQSQPAGTLTPAAIGATGLDESPFVAVANEVIPTVVSITAEKTVRTGGSATPRIEGPFEEFFRHFFPDGPNVPFDQSQTGFGSGVIVDPEGYIVTNNHVVDGYDRITVKLSDNTEIKSADVEVVGRDPKTDLAVLKVKADKPLPAVRFGSIEDTRVGAWAIAVGNAFGLQSTVTVGVISATGRSGIPLPEGPSYQDFIQTDASINPGNSGGALVNIRGELIGINSAIRSPVGANVGIGFAVPVDMVKNVSDQLREHGKVIRGFLGIRPQPVTEAISKALGLGSTRGVLVSEVLPDMPGEKAGLEDGDVILEVNGETMKDMDHFRRAVAEYAPGTTVTLTVFRDGKRLTKKVKLTEFPEDEQAGVTPEDEPLRPLGIAVRSLTRDERSEAGVQAGVLVEGVDRGSVAGDAGIQRGDIIIEIDGKTISSLSDFNREAERLAGEKTPALFRLKRGETRLFVAVEPGE